MTGREKMAAALSSEGAAELPVVLCYEGIYIRDRWWELSRRPWWFREAPDRARQRAWRSETIRALRQDWFQLPAGASRRERETTWIDQRDGQVLEVPIRNIFGLIFFPINK